VNNSKAGYKITLVIALLGVLTGCATERKCGIEGCPGDKAITERVQASFNRHPEIGVEVSVQTLDHVVYLSGFVSAGEMSEVANDVARHTAGVTRVVNSITVTH
jgi:osmotically-inducible protein OsmY